MIRNCTLITLFVVGLLLGWVHPLAAQRTQIRGFVDTYATYQKGQVNFGLGEQDLFITSEITPRLSFLGETVFKFSLASPTDFAISIERIILKYNYAGNHSFLIGKHHTPSITGMIPTIMAGCFSPQSTGPCCLPKASCLCTRRGLAYRGRIWGRSASATT
ncbi:hypothetical protein H9L05_00145 [Hymenobacter qilianensis]|uniref:Uncharacterized protein n=1 Tax=Hymenobacter qilianensis TaxID=1385715 RepID=A0A7H0GVG3_9BACT|nr:hypothetical protein [Hymenobacter qilianensis]QNP52279.1 hypothetical protein H9L05_00145 [Hymenobacter qilianensis]